MAIDLKLKVLLVSDDVLIKVIILDFCLFFVLNHTLLKVLIGRQDSDEVQKYIELLFSYDLLNRDLLIMAVWTVLKEATKNEVYLQVGLVEVGISLLCQQSV